jgi:hypothetical protein
MAQAESFRQKIFVISQTLRLEVSKNQQLERNKMKEKEATKYEHTKEMSMRLFNELKLLEVSSFHCIMPYVDTLDILYIL